jgi:hypothetical protein
MAVHEQQMRTGDTVPNAHFPFILGLFSLNYQKVQIAI